MADSLDPLTPKQVRAARALLAWSQKDLAQKAGVAASTIADFERGQRTPVPNNAEAIRRAFEQAQIHFPPGGAIVGPPIRGLAATTASGAPIRWVGPTDLAQWAERRDGQGSLPALIGKLVSASGAAQPHFPSDEGVQFGGWDGFTYATADAPYILAGTTGWEIGTQREGIRGKADKDYEKRTKNPGQLNPTESTFIFVTPRHWPEKDDWAAEKRSEGKWREVRAYDGTDLVHWIERYPAIGHELAVALGKRPIGARQLDEVWQEWSLATRWPLTAEVILSDRDEDVVAVLRWLREDPTAFALQSDAAEEVVAFLHAAINELPAQQARHYLARTLVADDLSVARALADSLTPLVVVLLEPDAGLAQAIAKKGHHVLLAYGGGAILDSDVRKLARPLPEGIRGALQSAGVPEETAQKLARGSSRSLTVLRRLAPAQAGRIPAWAQTAPPRGLLAALLAGAWDERSEADRRILERLAGTSYSDVADTVATFAGQFDRPLRKSGSLWKVASPRDAWLLLAHHLSSTQVEAFEAAVIDVLGSGDARYEMTDSERRDAALRGEKTVHSESLRAGLAEILIMFALFGDRAHTVSEASSIADRIVSKLLGRADGQRWWSLSNDFQLLAEAAPQEFLSAVQHSLDETPPPIGALFRTDNDGFADREYLAHLLWALESLAWAPEYLGQVATILAQLDELDPGGKYGNRPDKSLREIFVLWLPQTRATLDERLRVLDRIRKRYPTAAWKLMLGILPTGHDTLSPSATTRWRDMGEQRVEAVTYPLIHKGANAIAERLLTDVRADNSRWPALLERLNNFPDRSKLIAQLAGTVDMVQDEAQRAALRAAVRRALHRYRQFPDAEWTVPESELAELDKVYVALAPTDPVSRIEWLFGRGVGLPNPPGGDWKAEAKQLEALRTEEVAGLLRSDGADGIFRLLERIEDPLQLGIALAATGIDAGARELLLERALRGDAQRLHDFARGVIVASRPSDNDSWFRSLLTSAQSAGWGASAILTLITSIPINRASWVLAADAGPDVEKRYWRGIAIYAIEADDDEVALVVQKLLAANRARHALAFVEHKLSDRRPEGVAPLKVSPSLMVDILKQASGESLADTADRNEVTMFQHNVVEALKWLDRDPDVPDETMLRLEWIYLPLLEYSDRKPKVIMRSLARMPDLFIELICALFRPSPESGVVEEPPKDLEAAKRLAHHAFTVLEHWDVVPGTGSDGKTIDGASLEAWVKEARKLAKQRGRDAIADQKIGEILSASPIGDDGVWPAEPVREVIEVARSAHLETGFRIGKYNRRGVTGRLLRDGGTQERSLVEQLEAYRNATALEWPRTSAVLDQIAKSYGEQARFFDADAEQVDW